MNRNNSNDKDKLIKAVMTDNIETGQSHTFIRKLFNKTDLGGSRTNSLIIELINEGFMEYFPSHEKTNIKLTQSGQRAASIGYSILINEQNEIEKETKQLEIRKTRLEVKKLEFDDKWKWTIILSAIVSLISLLVSILKE